MRIIISGLSFELTDTIVRHVERRIKRSLGTASDEINAVAVRLSDINGNRGGAGKRCRVVIWLRPLRTVVAKATDRDLYAASDKAAGRAKEATWRQIKRPQIRRRGCADRDLERLLA